MNEVPFGGKIHSSPRSRQRVQGGPPEWIHCGSHQNQRPDNIQKVREKCGYFTLRFDERHAPHAIDFFIAGTYGDGKRFFVPEVWHLAGDKIGRDKIRAGTVR